jgi:hypothetical protein
MKKFLVKAACAAGCVLALHLHVLLIADGTTDPFYLRFTTPRQTSLIIGTSRAAQGILPETLNSALADTSLELPVFNFSFTLMHSPFGRVYLDAIRDKLQPQTKDGLFVVAADPFAVASVSKDPDDEAAFREAGQLLDSIPSVNGGRPNPAYFLNLKKGWGTVLASKMGFTFTRAKRLHEDGWLEITVPMNSALVRQRIDKKLALFEDNLGRYRISSIRRAFFERTIRFLAAHGRVFIVRLPAIGEVIAVENRLMPSFDRWVEEISERYNAPYLDFSERGDHYAFTDGSHLHKSSGRVFTRDIAARIRSRLQPKPLQR